MKLYLLIPAVSAILTLSLTPAFASPRQKTTQQPKPTQLYRGRATPLNTFTDQRFALINADGTIARSIGGVVSSQSFGSLGFTGAYEVIFNRDVTQCMYIGNPGSPGTNSPNQGEVAFTSRSGNPNGIFVERRDSAGNLSNRPFFVGVFCPRVTR
jgi:hypothetical protein